MLDSHDDFRHRLSGRWCSYCGDIADTMDHFPPRSVTNYGLLIPCCRECNSSLSTLYAFSFKDRAALAKRNIRSKYKKLLRIPDWTDEEFEEMALHMKESVLAGQRIRDQIKERLAWNAWSYLKGIDTKNDFERVVEEIEMILGNMNREFERSEPPKKDGSKP